MVLVQYNPCFPERQSRVEDAEDKRNSRRPSRARHGVAARLAGCVASPGVREGGTTSPTARGRRRASRPCVCMDAWLPIVERRAICVGAGSVANAARGVPRVDPRSLGREPPRLVQGRGPLGEVTATSTVFGGVLRAPGSTTEIAAPPAAIRRAAAVRRPSALSPAPAVPC